MADRSKTQLDWQQSYTDKIKRVNEILHAEQLSLQQLRANAVVNAWDSAKTTMKNLFSGGSGSTGGNAVGSTRAGTFSLPSTLKSATLSGGKVSIPGGNRKEYHKARDIAAKESDYAGFQAISENMYSFPNCPEENYFAPDFIPILALIHSKVAPALGVDKIKLNSGTRKTPIDEDYDAHMGGYAIDMGLTGADRYTAADICWELGLRGVAVGKTFIHVDSGPDPVVGWKYDGVPLYRGPSSAR